MAYTYKNTNAFTVIIPGPRGVGVTFRPGEGSSSEWFSRFVGPRQLTKVEASSGEVVRSPLKEAPAPPPIPGVTAPPRESPVKVEFVVEEQTLDYTKKKGIYYCKHCDTFSTGSKAAMDAHTRGVHATTPDTGAAKKKDGIVRAPVIEQEAVSVSTATPDKKPLPEVPPKTEDVHGEEVDAGDVAAEVPEPEAPKPEAPKPEASKPEAPKESGHQCPHCTRMFKSVAGLASHVRSKHPDVA